MQRRTFASLRAFSLRSFEGGGLRERCKNQKKNRHWRASDSAAPWTTPAHPRCPPERRSGKIDTEKNHPPSSQPPDHPLSCRKKRKKTIYRRKKQPVSVLPATGLCALVERKTVPCEEKNPRPPSGRRARHHRGCQGIHAPAPHKKKTLDSLRGRQAMHPMTHPVNKKRQRQRHLKETKNSTPPASGLPTPARISHRARPKCAALSRPTASCTSCLMRYPESCCQVMCRCADLSPIKVRCRTVSTDGRRQHRIQEKQIASRQKARFFDTVPSKTWLACSGPSNWPSTWVTPRLEGPKHQ